MEEDKMPMRHGCDDDWTWSFSDRSSEVRLYDMGRRVAHFHPNWSAGTAGVQGTRVLNNGRYYWELKLSQRVFGTSMMFGIATKAARLHAHEFVNLIGEDEHGWGLSHKGLLFHGGKYAYYTPPFEENVSTTVGLLFDGIAGTLTFYKDGLSLGVAFKDLHKVKENLYPMISSTAAKTEMTLTHMKRDFVNLQDRCRAVIVSQLNSPSDIDNIVVEPDYFLPLKVKKYLAAAMCHISKPTKKYSILDF